MRSEILKSKSGGFKLRNERSHELTKRGKSLA